MKIIFANVTLACDPAEGGGAWISGLLVKGQQNVQEVTNLLRAPDAMVYPRGNRIYTVPMTIMPAPYASNGAALVALLLYLQSLPASGALSIEEDGITVNYSNAVLKSISPPYRIGVSFAVDLVFIATQPSQGAAPAYTTQSGQAYTTQDGTSLTPNS